MNSSLRTVQHLQEMHEVKVLGGIQQIPSDDAVDTADFLTSGQRTQLGLKSWHCRRVLWLTCIA